MAESLTKKTYSAVDSITAEVLARTVLLGDERPDALNMIAQKLNERASELREQKINQAQERAAEDREWADAAARAWRPDQAQESRS